MSSSLAPAVAVVGPANSGKTTLLNLLDEALQHHPAAPLVHVVKGNPDGTGRYLLHAPELREELKDRVKGAWCDTTVETVCRWVEAGRRRLALVLVDFGGKHAPTNEVMLRQCSHSLVLARRFDDSCQEKEEGLESWSRVCRDCGLAPLARLVSLWRNGEAEVLGKAPDGALEATFRADAGSPESTTNAVVLRALVDALLALAVKPPILPYLDLRLPGRDWSSEDLDDLGGRAPRIGEILRRGDPLVLGGRAPIWAYAAALHHALDLDPAACIEVFDPKVPGALVEIPSRLEAAGGDPVSGSVQLTWQPREGGATRLTIAITTPDRLLTPDAAEHLASLRPPEGEAPVGPVVVDGPAPIWLHLTCSRWLRTVPGVTSIGLWDARSRKEVWVRRDRGSCVHLFLRCGELYSPPDEDGPWQIVTLPEILTADDLGAAVGRVRRALSGHRSARLVIAGPVTLGVALGQGLAHDPVAIDYVQLNQATKDFEVWVSNRRNL